MKPTQVLQSRNKFSGFRSAGVNRLSIGIQSFNDQHLLQLGRIHDGSQALSAIDTARRAGFDNFNLDLMHGLSGQTVEQARQDLQLASDSGALHISWYQLTIEPNTEFYSRPPQLPEEDALVDIQQAGMELLDDGGYAQYEVSAFAQPGQASQHNMNYWQFGDYLGIGAGAHGKITVPAENCILRSNKTRQPDNYLARDPLHSGSAKTHSLDELAVEFMMNGLRLRDGLSADYFHVAHRPTCLKHCQASGKTAVSGTIGSDDRRYQTTALGYQFLNSTLQGFS